MTKVHTTMPRILFILILLAVSFFVIKSIRKKLDDNKQLDSKQSRDDKQQILKCNICNLHIPENEAIRQGEQVFCSLEHAKKHLE